MSRVRRQRFFRDRSKRIAALVTACAAALTLAGCRTEETGYLEVKTVPATMSAPALYLNTDRLDPLKKGNGVLRLPVGTVKLQAELAGQLTALCGVEVRKNRITSVTLSVAERPPRCQCRYATGSAPPRDAAARVCLS